MNVAYPVTQRVKTNAKLLSVAGNEARIRIFCLMFDKKQARVSEIAELLGMSVASISHHLQIMKENGFFETERCGNSICYKLLYTPFTKKLKSFICD